MSTLKKTPRKTKEIKETKNIDDLNTVVFFVSKDEYTLFEDSDILRLKRAFNVSITFDGDRFLVTSSNIKQCRKAVIVLEKIFNLINKGIEVLEEDVTFFINEQNPAPLANSKYKAIFTSFDGVEYSPRTDNQEYFIELINHNTITIAAGAAGTGKTRLASIMAARYIKENRFDSIKIFRPLQAVGNKSVGFLPGNISEKVDPYASAVINTFNELLSEKVVEAYTKTKRLEIGSIALIRGETFNDCIIILDEVQNMSKMEILTLLTRIGFNTKVIITGDQSQSDVAYKKEMSGLEYCLDRLKDIDGVGIVKMTIDDIQRNGIIKEIIKNFED